MTPRGVLLAVLVVVLIAGAYVLVFARGQGVASQLPQFDVPGADTGAGKNALAQMGCGSCHSVPGVANARGKVGPPLVDLADRVYIAGRLPNTPENLALWIQHPQLVDPGNAMPDMGVSQQDALNIAAFLYTVR
ncbi:MAG TPA: c-type cytochrome [Deinococcales bacterium]|nr:c-type cytochrome [Deinococcales bacterium]